MTASKGKASKSTGKRKRDEPLSSDEETQDTIPSHSDSQTDGSYDSSDSSAQENKRRRLDGKEKDKSSLKKRYVVFIGNLPFTATRQEIMQHFSYVGVENIVELRLMTPKGSNGTTKKKGKKKGEPEHKGCGFMEFANEVALKKSLSLHHSEMRNYPGRKINVEFTAGGGGSGKNRMKKIEKKNKALAKERQKRFKKITSSPKPKKSAESAGSVSKTETSKPKKADTAAKKAPQKKSEPAAAAQATPKTVRGPGGFAVRRTVS